MRTPPTNVRFDPDGPGARRERTERRILEGAARLIADGVAWNQLGIRQIAEHAEISRTAFYDFFGSKNEVLEQLISGLHEDLAQVIIEIAPYPNGPPSPSTPLQVSQLRAVLAAIADFNTQHGAIYRAFLDATGEDPRLDDLWDDLTGIYVHLITQAIDQVRAAHPGAPVESSSESLARVLLVMTERTMLLILRQPPDAVERAELLEALAQVWERSVLGAAAAPAA